MAAKPFLIFAALCGLCLSARADDLAAPRLPIFASNPPAASPWSGLYVGSEVLAVARKGAKGQVGGDVFAGYRRELDDHLVIGVEASTGFAPNLLQRSRYVGYDYAATKVKLGYEMGRLTPFVTAGFAFAKPNTSTGGYASATGYLNDLLDSRSNLRTFGTVGAGFDYAVTDKLSVGLAVSASTGRGLVAP